jgi:translation initiation factor 4E
MDNISSLNKALQSSSIADFSSLNLKIPDTLRQKNKFSHSISLNQSFTSNYSQNYGLSNIQNIFPSPSLPLQNFFGFVLKNGYISNFVPITFSCSIDIPRNRKGHFRSRQKEQEFFEKIIKIADVKDMSEFWSVFQHLKKPNECSVGTDYHVFKQGIVPMWEDSNNKNGGKLSVLLTWKFANVIWEETVFNFVKGYLPSFEYINGIVISNRPNFLVLSFWIKTGNNIIVEKIRNALSELLQTPSLNCIDFIPFN